MHIKTINLYLPISNLNCYVLKRIKIRSGSSTNNNHPPILDLLPLFHTIFSKSFPTDC